jgi:hypothetical protein
MGAGRGFGKGVVRDEQLRPPHTREIIRLLRLVVERSAHREPSATPGERIFLWE